MPSAILTAALAPVLLAQGLWTRWRTVKPGVGAAHQDEALLAPTP